MHHVCRCILWFIMIPIIFIYLPEDRECDIPSLFWLRYRWMFLCLYNASSLPIHFKYGGLFVNQEGTILWAVKLLVFYLIGSIWLLYGFLIFTSYEDTCGWDDRLEKEYIIDPYGLGWLFLIIGSPIGHINLKNIRESTNGENERRSSGGEAPNCVVYFVYIWLNLLTLPILGLPYLIILPCICCFTCCSL
jgi:hypothetical protein